MQGPPGPGFINKTSEDCLTLNVWRPHRRRNRALPVMVWIYGGAFIMGAGSFPPYDGTSFAEKGVILVNFNYRMGRFGTFAHPALTKEAAGGPVADYGTMDQIAVLQWVQKNIASFGGDPASVTIFGESAGASSVNFLMASPLARHLFARAISESGGSSANLQSLPQAEAQGVEWAKSVGVADGDLAALRRLPAATVWSGPVMAPAFPVIDGKIITESTNKAFADGTAAPVPYLVGSNGYEESLLRWLPDAGNKLVRDNPHADVALQLYAVSGRSDNQAMQKMWGDQAMTLPARTRAADMAGRGAKTWLYRYAYVPESLRGTLPGAGHEAEIEMVFNTRNGRVRHAWSDRDLAMAHTVQGYWVNFARNGNPNGPGLPVWPAYTIPGQPEIVFADTGVTVARDLDKKRLDILQSSVAP